jgi:hypothetical protein
MPLRVSIRALMAFVVWSAVVFASLHEPSDLWATGMFSLSALAAGVALIVTFFGPPRQRGTWGGAFVLGGGYLIICFGAGTEQRLPSTAVADSLYRGMDYTPRQVDERVWVQQSVNQVTTTSVEGKVIKIDPSPPEYHVITPGWTSSYPAKDLRPLGRDAYRQLCHADASLLLTLVGALVGRLASARREPASGPGDAS